jgi:cation diffusion facilitator CzcD-associated flavoprotein CzcO
MHSANWDTSFDWTEKRVALIGAGSSGIQILPQIQPKAKQVVHFMKGKTWISPVGYGAEEGDSSGEGNLLFSTVPAKQTDTYSAAFCILKSKN